MQYIDSVTSLLKTVWTQVFSVRLPILEVTAAQFTVSIVATVTLLRVVIGLFIGHVRNRDSSVGTSERMRHKK